MNAVKECLLSIMSCIVPLQKKIHEVLILSQKKIKNYMIPLICEVSQVVKFTETKSRSCFQGLEGDRKEDGGLYV